MSCPRVCDFCDQPITFKYKIRLEEYKENAMDKSTAFDICETCLNKPTSLSELHQTLKNKIKSKIVRY